MKERAHGASSQELDGPIVPGLGYGRHDAQLHVPASAENLACGQLLCDESSQVRERMSSENVGNGSIRGIVGSGTGKRPLQHQAHARLARRALDAVSPLRQAPHKLDPRRLFTIVLSNNQFGLSTTATVDITSREVPVASTSKASTTPTVTTSRISSRATRSGTSSQVRRTPLPQSREEEEVSSRIVRETVTLKNESPTGALPPYPLTTETTSSTSRRLTRTRRPRPETTVEETPSSPTSRSLSRTRTRTRTREDSGTSTARDNSSTRSSRVRTSTVADEDDVPATNIVRVCISRPSIPSQDDDEDDENFATTLVTSRIRPDGGGNARPTGSRDRRPVLTVTDFNCATLSSASTESTDFYTSLPTQISDDLNDNDSSSISMGIPPHNKASDGDAMPAFFATPAGRGTIAGISIGSAALLFTLVFFFLWRRRKGDDEDEDANRAGAAGNRGSGSSFGDSSQDQSGARGMMPDYSPSLAAGPAQNTSPEMAQRGTGPPGSFFVESRRYEDFAAQKQRSPTSDAIQVASAAAAKGRIPVSPLERLEQQPRSYMDPQHAGTHAPYMQATSSNEGPSSSGENVNGSGSSQGHDPFKDPSSPGHSSFTHDRSAAALGMTGKGPERRHSGYTSDTYRRRKSRPLSVRNPDSDDTVPEHMEALQSRTPPQLTGGSGAYSVDEMPVPGSSGLEYYLGNTAVSPMPPNIGIVPPSMPATPERSYQQLANAPGDMPPPPVPPPSLQQQMPQQQQQWQPWQPSMSFAKARKSLCYGSAGAQAGPSGSTARDTYLTYDGQSEKPPAQTSVPHQSSREHLNPTTPAATVLRGQMLDDTRPHRPSFASSDGDSTRSSLWRAWEHTNRSWVNDGYETPHDVQDVQLGSNAIVGTGNNTAVAGYFTFR